eukprot:46757-Eustigmatos_ZCMA.PRE.1
MLPLRLKHAMASSTSAMARNSTSARHTKAWMSPGREHDRSRYWRCRNRPSTTPDHTALHSCTARGTIDDSRPSMAGAVKH